MLQSVNNLTQQAVVSPLQQRGDQQQQVNERRQQEQTSVSNRNTQTQETRRSGTAPAQAQGTNSRFLQNPTELSVSEFRSQFGEGTPPRGSLVDISA
jgi:hypothetical protein